MKRCKSDDLTPDEEGGRTGLSAVCEDAPSVLIVEVKHGDTPDSSSAGGTANSHSTARSKPPDLKKIQQLSEGSVFGHGLKHLFHSRRRSREREQHSSPDSAQAPQLSVGYPAGAAGGPGGHSDHDSADEKERSPEMQRVSYAVSLQDLPARPTAFNRVLQQIRARPSIKRGSSLHSSSRRTKSGPASEAVKSSSPHLGRKGPQDSSLTALLHQGRPRSSSTTDTSLLAGEPTLHWTVEEPERVTDRLEKGEVSTLGLPPNTSHAGSDGNISLDVPEAPDPQRTKAAIEHLQQKILKITEQIRIEQEAAVGRAPEAEDPEQASRIKQVFEKKNQKSAQTISHLHKKLEHYHRKLKEIEQNGPTRQPKDVLRDMQQGLKGVGPPEGNQRLEGGWRGEGGPHPEVKPREFASLIRNKFGSADNITHLKDTLEDPHPEDSQRPFSGSATLVSSPKYGSDDDCSSATSGSPAGSNSGAGGPGLGPGPGMGSPKSNTLDSHHHHHHNNLDTLLEELREIKDSQGHLEDSMEDLKTQLQRDYSYMTQCLQEERYRYERLEEQLNDLTELHQNEMTNLKQELASMEEKVAYQSYERARDIQEAVESCLTRITTLELQQQQQQVVQLEGVENANARALLGKFINVILALMAVLLVFVSTLANFITPLMKTRMRIFASVFLALFLIFLWKHWDSVAYVFEPWLLPS
ncbi:transmembrane and coiled-coil domains protein 2 isoform X1 [Huso huso]|uniref:Transmembrane and coiled-coil domains protein 2 isoform X1 n=1 Tax=Huso huso TaxID=61971 RepID=A0ABR0YHH2_HUSHU